MVYNICLALVALLPIGIPVFLGALLHSHQVDIEEHKGPHHVRKNDEFCI